MHFLNNDQLISAYIKSINLELELDFIELLEQELYMRKINPDTVRLMIG
ncbi:sporulation histidine kinase inhibitor Sda [Piscibacillus salipiscarius]|uniref:Sporulation histidine kinase inhibitor Sda n=1 Tax=Piscibacillus salipiscarius TaxID=299480 RepID=A0ABW5Q6R7_9BACI|nr:sporulation histidine kinase inhibitor Sda [Piscibacillus salipiscarius]